MKWAEELTKDNCSWESPNTTGGTTEELLKTIIRNGIDRVKKLQAQNGYQPGEFLFKLYLEPDGSEYRMYFLMG